MFTVPIAPLRTSADGTDLSQHAVSSEPPPSRHDDNALLPSQVATPASSTGVLHKVALGAIPPALPVHKDSVVRQMDSGPQAPSAMPSHDEPPQRENRARLGAPRLLKLRSGTPSAQFLLCRSNTPPMRPHPLRPCLVSSLQRRLVVSAPQPLSPRRHHRQKSSSWSRSGGIRMPIGRVNNTANRFVTPPSGIPFSEVPRSSPTIFSFNWRFGKRPPLSEVRQ